MTEQHPPAPRDDDDEEVGLALPDVDEAGGMPDLSALLGGADLGGLLEAAQAMQANLFEAQAQAAAQVVEGSAGGGAVRIEATAGLEFRRVTISPDAAGDAEMLEDLVLAALRDVVARANEAHQAALGDLGGLPGMGGPGGLPLGEG